MNSEDVAEIRRLSNNSTYPPGQIWQAKLTSGLTWEGVEAAIRKAREEGLSLSQSLMVTKHEAAKKLPSRMLIDKTDLTQAEIIKVHDEFHKAFAGADNAREVKIISAKIQLH